MNKRIFILVLLILLAAQFACQTSTPTEPGPTAIPTIGVVNRIKGSVEAGPESALEIVNSVRNMNNNDAIHIKDDGKASLDFGYGLDFTLYNDTVFKGTSVDTYETSLQVTTHLSEGGLNAHNPPDSRTEVFLPNDAKIIILGTHYFITYDPTTDIAWVYNLDGTVQYTLPGGQEQDLVPRSLVEFNRSDVIQVYEDLTFSTDDFDRFATQFNSPIQGVEELLKIKLPTATPTLTPTFPPTSTITPTFTPSPTYTPSLPMLTLSKDANCRRGPGTTYGILTSFLAGQVLQIEGQNDFQPRWWLVVIPTPPNGTCWVSDVVGTTSGQADQVGIVAAPPPPPADFITFLDTEDCSVELRWSDVSNEIGYRVFRDKSLAVELPANTTYYQENYGDFPWQESHTYYIQAYNAAGSANSSEETVTDYIDEYWLCN